MCAQGHWPDRASFRAVAYATAPLRTAILPVDFRAGATFSRSLRKQPGAAASPEPNAAYAAKGPQARGSDTAKPRPRRLSPRNGRSKEGRDGHSVGSDEQPSVAGAPEAAALAGSRSTPFRKEAYTSILEDSRSAIT